ncbi:uncharacterized protein MONBRDRAFT_32036 [Monosiga brevicollis MX1]|uniref:Syndetin C-terminal domain-containing protein n=1 Tax=Monosiga brevicollis TaxID=81824 RepID=A9UWZ5_MONBE|nr:uncharacterized protein MONBRDRAFT_32036 [Monosiga brevicollis MX1]EDQ90303.1 predicted protein [Monosiga brevicollis MX1]|eukprot:XP_001745070.1 hypothetical protein [Monosiga brevicollis MX1]
MPAMFCLFLGLASGLCLVVTFRNTAPQPTIRATARVHRPPVPPDEELLAKLDPAFSDQETDIIRHSMNEFAADMPTREQIDERRKLKYQQLAAVSKKLSGLVLDHHKQFMTELARVTELSEQLQMTVVVCKNGRRLLNKAETAVSSSLEVLLKDRRKRRMIHLLKSLQAIAIMRTADTRLSQLLEERDFLGAIELWKNCRVITTVYDEYDCIRDLAAQLGEGTPRIIGRLQVELETMLDDKVLTPCRDGIAPDQVATLSFAGAGEILDAYSALEELDACIDAVATRLCSYPAKLARSVLGELTQIPNIRRAPLRTIFQQIKPADLELGITRLCRAYALLMLFFDRVASVLLEANHKARVSAAAESTDPGEPHDLDQEHAGFSDGTSISAPPTPRGGTISNANAPSSERFLSVRDDRLGALFRKFIQTIAAVASSRLTRFGWPHGSDDLDYVPVRVQHARFKLWQDLQRQLVLVLASSQIAALNAADYMELITHVRCFGELGEDFSGRTDSNLMAQAIKDQTRAYVINFHRRTLGEFRGVIESDNWAPAPVAPDFNIFFLPEFAFLRKPRTRDGGSQEIASNAINLDGDGLAETETDPATLVDFVQAPDKFFVVHAQAQETTALNAKSAATTPVKTSKPRTAGGTPQRPIPASAPVTPAKGAPPPPHCSQSALRLTAECGRYLQMMQVFPAIASDTFARLTELVDMYIYAVFHFFAEDQMFFSYAVLSPTANSLLERVRRPFEGYPPGTARVAEGEATDDNVRSDEEEEAEESGANPTEAEPDMELAPRPPQAQPLKLHSDVERDNASSLFGLAARVSGAEGLNFVSTVLRSLRNNIVRRLDSTGAQAADSYLKQTVDHFKELRWYIYKNVVFRMMPSDKMTAALDGLKWDVKEITTEHSPYVDELIADVRVIHTRLDLLGTKRLPEPALKTIWNEIYSVTNMAFVDGFASAKKCTNEGRAKMQLDYKHFLNKIGSLSPVKPTTDVVQNYIQAYYLSDADLEQWIRTNHQVYTARQLSQLIAVTPHKKAQRQKLQKVVDEVKA